MSKADRVPTQAYGFLMSDEQAAHALDLTVEAFRNLVKKGVIPKGRPVAGSPGMIRWHQSVIIALSYQLVGMTPPPGVDSPASIGAALSAQDLDNEFD